MFRFSALMIVALTAANAPVGQELPDGAIRRIGGGDASDPLRGVYLVAFSPDGKLLATRSRDQTVRLWDTETGKERFTLDGHEDRVTSLSFSQDGKTLATTSPGTNEVVRLWNTATGKNFDELKHGGAIVKFLPDSQELLVINSATAFYYDAKTYVEKNSVSLGNWPIQMPLAVSPTGKWLAFYKPRATSDEHFGVFVRDIKSTVVYCVSQHEATPVTGRFSPNDTKLTVSFRREEDVHVLVVGNSNDHRTRPAHDAQIQSISYSPDGRLMATASWDKTVRVWEVLTDGLVATLPGHTEHVCAVAFSPDGTRLASGASGPTDNSTLSWDVRRILFGPIEQESATLTDEELSEVWEDLSTDSSRAFRAMAILVHAPLQSTPYLVKQVKDLVPKSDPATIDRLILELDSDTFKVREAAHRKLIDLRVIAEAQLRKALKETGSFEVRSRIMQILAQKESERKLTDGERKRIHRMIYAMELIGTTEMKQQLVKIASGFPNSEIIAAASAAANRLSFEVQEQN